MTHTWHDLLFAHFRVDPATLRRLVPEVLTLDVYRDEAWLSIFPPRPYNWHRAFAAIEHDGLPAEYSTAQLEGADAYPSKDLIEAAAKNGWGYFQPEAAESGEAAVTGESAPSGT